MTNYTKKELLDILKENSQNDWLFSHANKVRQENVGDEIHLRGLIEFSNICKNSCKYCGLRCANKNIERYRLSIEQITQDAQIAIKLGYKTIVLQSGEDEAYTTKDICKIIENIKNFDVALTLSIGERSFQDYKEFKNAGADRYLIRIETTDENLYKKMHPYMSFENRLRCLKDLKKLGYEVGTGCLVGLPEQTFESLVNDILFFKDIDADMIGIGPFISHPQTPLANAKNGDFTLALKVMALTRLLLPDINIPATTAMETINPNGRIIALQSGANVIMPNVTTCQYQEKYEIYPNKSHSTSIEYTRQNIENIIKSIGRTISATKGFHNKKLN